MQLLLVKAQLGAGDAAGAANTVRDLERSMEGQAKMPLCRALSNAMVATHAGDTDKATAITVSATDKRRLPILRKLNVSMGLIGSIPLCGRHG